MRSRKVRVEVGLAVATQPLFRFHHVDSVPVRLRRFLPEIEAGLQQPLVGTVIPIRSQQLAKFLLSPNRRQPTRRLSGRRGLLWLLKEKWSPLTYRHRIDTRKNPRAVPRRSPTLSDLPALAGHQIPPSSLVLPQPDRRRSLLSHRTTSVESRLLHN
jgi:hypothetical protein